MIGHVHYLRIFGIECFNSRLENMPDGISIYEVFLMVAEPSAIGSELAHVAASWAVEQRGVRW